MAPIFSSEYRISFEIRPNYLLVLVDLPTNAYNVARQYWTEVVRMIHKGRYAKVAVNVSASRALPADDAKSLMGDILKIIYPGIQIAIINPHVNEEVQSSIETSAEEQGRSMKIVQDLASAETWFNGGQLNVAPAVLNSTVQDLTSSTLPQ